MTRDTGVGWPDGPGPGRAAEQAAERPPAGPSPAPPDEPAPDERLPDGPVPAAAPPPRRRMSAAGAVVGLLVGLLGFAFVVQVKSNATDPQLAAARPEDLVRILSDLQAREDRLHEEISELEEAQRQLTSGAEGQRAALEEARRRADELGILAGTLPAEGFGLVVLVAPDRARPVKASAILDAVQELRGAGAEAMQIAGAGGTPVRIVASTAFVDGDGGLLTGGQRLLPPYTITVIGDPQTMETALNIPGGVVETVQKDGGTVAVHRPGQVRVTALHRQTELRYAEPAS